MVVNSLPAWVETWGTGGTVPPNLRWGRRPMYPSPNILRSTVIGCEGKYELTKRRCQGGFSLSEIEIFGQDLGQEKGHICYVYMFYIRFKTVETERQSK